MSEYNRDHFGRRSHDDDDQRQRWRRAEERYRREAQGHAQDDGRTDANRRDYYGSASREDDRNQGNYGYGPPRDDSRRDNDWRHDRDWRSERDWHGQRAGSAAGAWHDDHHHAGGYRSHPGEYGGTGDSPYFTGTQGSWAIGDANRGRGAGSYGGSGLGGYGAGYGGRFGDDYRDHGYGRHSPDNRRGFWDRASDEVASWFGDEDATRRREADHRGRGPKDYTRSDERIREDANDRLTEDWRVDASNVTVTVQQGELTLNGTVGSREAKRRAEDVVENVSGVKHVQNNLRVSATTGGGHESNWALNRSSTAEGGTLGANAPTGDVTRSTNKV